MQLDGIGRLRGEGLKLEGVGEIDGEGVKLKGVAEIRGEDNTGPIVPEEISFKQKIFIRGEITIEKQGVPGLGLQGVDVVSIGGGVAPPRISACNKPFSVCRIRSIR